MLLRFRRTIFVYVDRDLPERGFHSNMEPAVKLYLKENSSAQRLFNGIYASQSLSLPLRQTVIALAKVADIVELLRFHR